MTFRSRLLLVFFVLLILWIFAIGRAHYLFTDTSYSPVLYSKEGPILSAKVAKDGQWRFLMDRNVPEKLKSTIVHYEDRYFNNHLGVNPISLFRAIYQNLKSGKVISGGSTITMQLAKIGLKNKRRNIWNKLNECIVAVGLECIYKKHKIISLYSAHIPYGSNIVGVEAAMWRYYGKNKSDITWSEAALLAILPNQPNIILQKNKVELIKQKRNRLLLNLLKAEIIDSLNYEISLLEEIPNTIYKFDKLAPHALETLIQKNPQQLNFKSSIKYILQEKINEIVLSQHELLRQKDIHNISVLVVENSTGQIHSYIGNVHRTDIKVPQAAVDMIIAPRSSGSTLKPFLVASMLDQGLITPTSLIPDIPTLLGGFRPENFNRSYAGVVTVNELIHRSLNVPSVWLLRDYGVHIFYNDLKKLGFRSLFRNWEDYGLSLILGGAEVTMHDLSRAYAYLANSLEFYRKNNGTYLPFSKYKISVLDSSLIDTIVQLQSPEIYSVGSIWHMFSTMRQTEEPGEYQQIAIKTGTSFGYKDAWCMGVTPKYTVCVWVGNASGLSRPDLIGMQIATPMVYDIYKILANSGEWWCPFDNMDKFGVCKQSGYAPGPYCEEFDTTYLPKTATKVPQCSYHKQIFLSKDLKFMVSKECAIDLISSTHFVLPPVLDYFYRKKNHAFKSLPNWHPDCPQNNLNENSELEFIYPNENSSIAAPLNLDGDQNNFIFKATHKNQTMQVYWFLDHQYISSTVKDHQLLIIPSAGNHILSIMDQNGLSSTVKIKVLD
ncbi:MAG: penicillin-binding protein 1C [Saprospiraceae bacterium]|nr:penicillin-binding protein 1C [Saprospiraceae bacterium]